jgi:hypothetical protein
MGPSAVQGFADAPAALQMSLAETKRGSKPAIHTKHSGRSGVHVTISCVVLPTQMSPAETKRGGKPATSSTLIIHMCI